MNKRLPLLILSTSIFLTIGCSNEVTQTQTQTKTQPVPEEEKKVESVTKDYEQNQQFENATEVNGLNVILNPANELAMVNKMYTLPGDYTPEDLVVPNVPFSFTEDLEKRYLKKEAANTLEEMFIQAKEENINIVAVSGYRSYNRQKQIYDAKVNQVGKEKANQVVAVPGQSEHQTGLAMDVSSPDMNFSLEENFGETKEGIWLKNNAHKYGFIIRYPKGKEGITGYQYEPWHLRYVGKEAAKLIYEDQLTLEEYIEKNNGLVMKK